MNYTELKTAVEDYTENSFSATDFATMTELAEQKIYNSVQLPALRKNVTGVLSQNNKYLSCPNDFLSVFSLAVILPSGSYEYLLDKDVNFIRQAYPSPTSTGVPRYYAIFGPTTTNDPSPIITDELTLILGPTPNASYNVELHYYYYPESITVAVDGRTWLGDSYSPVLLYGTLVEAYTFLKGEQDMIAQYEKKYQEAMGQLNRLGTGLERGDAYRDGQAKIKVNP